MKKNKSYYRADIEGLRALAIIPVVLFHAGFSLFSGGFVGVDIFFVISGFLITSILLRELNKGTFSFINFWERRIRRIFPALLTVLFTTTTAAYIYFRYPLDFIDYGKSLFSQSLFHSNLFFMRREGYFAEPSEISPLLHTWSLSIEEQFYIFLPVFLLLIWTFFRKRLILCFVGAGLLSFALNVYMVNVAPNGDFGSILPNNILGDTINQTAGFYILPTRVWEFIVGALISVSAISIRKKVPAEVISILGMIAILYSVSQFSLNTPFPGVAAIIPVLGSAAIIIANTHIKTSVSKILSYSVLVWFGLISYSLYLWHWPIFVFANTILDEITMLDTISLILLSVTLAWITYRLIEIPFGEKRYIPKQSIMIAVGLVTLFFIAVLGYSMKFIDTNARIPSHSQEFFEAKSDIGPRFNDCFLDRKLNNYINNGPCVLGIQKSTVETTFIVWGDSHAAAMLDTLHNLASDNNVRGVFFASPACLPVNNASINSPNNECKGINKMALEYIQKNKTENIFLIARWDYHTKPIDEDCTQCSVNENSIETQYTEEKSIFEARLRTMITGLTDEGSNIFILKQVPDNKLYNLRNLFYSSIHNGEKTDMAPLSIIDYKKQGSFTDTVFTELARLENVSILDPTNLLCAVDICLFEVDGKQIYRDGDHLNFTGANILESLFEDPVVNLSKYKVK